MSEHVLSQRADLALANLTADGGLLTPEQNDTFIRLLIDQPTILNECRTVTMSRPQMDLNKIQFGQRILRPATQVRSQTTDPYPPERRLTVLQRSKPQTSKISMSTKEVIAEVRINYETLEDNIEGSGLQNTILQLIAQRAALDLEELLISGDTTSGDAYLAQMDGAVKRLNVNVVDSAGAPIDADVFNRSIKALPTRYRRNKSLMRFYPHMDVEQDYRMKLTSRGSPLGDNILTGDQAVGVFGVPMKGVALMPTDKMLFTNPKNIIFGIQRNVRIETDRQIQDREIIIVLTARIAIQVEEPEAAVKVVNIGSL